MHVLPGDKERACIRYDDPNDVDKAHSELDVPLGEISDRVHKATIALCGEGANIKNQLITLQVTRPDAPDLTLIDLPGIVRVRTGVNFCCCCMWQACNMCLQVHACKALSLSIKRGPFSCKS